MFEHWGGAIYWDTMTWEAFVAMLAVGAAALVGFRQVGIQRRQAEIEALTVRIALREERLKVYDATRRFIGNILTTGRVPGRQTLAASMAGGDVAQPEVAIDFYDAMDRARFLFAPAVRATLVGIYELAMELGDIRASPDTFYEASDGRSRTRAQEIRDELSRIYGDVAGIFGNELMLTDTEGSMLKRR